MKQLPKISNSPSLLLAVSYSHAQMWGGAKLRMTFENVTINTDYQLMDGEFVAVKNWKKPQITNLNPQKEEPTFGGNQGIAIKEVAFTIPDDASFMFDKSTGKIDINVNGQSIGTLELQVPPTTEGDVKNIWASTFPMTVKDKDGNEYKVEYDETAEPAENGEVPLVVTKVDNSSTTIDSTNNMYVTTDGSEWLLRIDYKNTHKESLKGHNTIYYTKDAIESLKFSVHQSRVGKTQLTMEEMVDSLKWYIDEKFQKQGEVFELKIDRPGDYKITTQGFVLNEQTQTKEYKEVMTVTIKVVNSAVLTFREHGGYQGEYGFDRYEFDQLKSTYDNILQIANTEYVPPYMTMLLSQPPAKVEVEVTAPLLTKSTKLCFFNDMDYPVYSLPCLDSAKVANQKNEKIELQIPPSIFNGTEYISALDENCNEIGRLYGEIGNVGDPIQITLIKVYADEKEKQAITNTVFEKDLIKVLNETTYNQSFMKFELTAKIICQIDTSKNPDFSSQVIGNHEAFFQYLISQYRGVNPNQLIIFVTDKGCGSEPGAGGRASFIAGERRFILIFDQGLERPRTGAHEIGHALDLRHPDDPKYGYRETIKKKNTRNIMDYAEQLMFWKWQIKKIQTVNMNDVFNTKK